MLAILERMKAVSINLEYLRRSYFYFDKPVDYKLQNEKIIEIYPVQLKDSEFFLSSVDLLKIDKNATPSVEIIQMSYLQFICDVLLAQSDDNRQRFLNILILCLHQENLKIFRNEKGKPFLADDRFDIIITHNDFEDIKRIILYQNFVNFDDSYVNPDLKQAMLEMDELRSKGIEVPSLERRIAIISSHTGIKKKEQLDMTYRSHELLFDEVCGEIDFVTIRPIALYCGKGNDFGHWIYKKKTNKYDNYITSVENYKRKMGDNSIRQTSTSDNIGLNFEQQFQNFNK